jgi:hypothetical protein
VTTTANAGRDAAMSTVVNPGSRAAAILKKGLVALGIALLVFVGLLAPDADLFPGARHALSFRGVDGKGRMNSKSFRL